MTDWEKELTTFICSILCNPISYTNCTNRNNLECGYVKVVTEKFQQEIKKAVDEVLDGEEWFSDTAKILKSRGIE